MSPVSHISVSPAVMGSCQQGCTSHCPQVAQLAEMPPRPNPASLRSGPSCPALGSECSYVGYLISRYVIIREAIIEVPLLAETSSSRGIMEIQIFFFLMCFCSNNCFFSPHCFSSENTGMLHQQQLIKTSHVLLIILASHKRKREGLIAPNFVQVLPKVKYPAMSAPVRLQLCWV